MQHLSKDFLNKPSYHIEKSLSYRMSQANCPSDKYKWGTELFMKTCHTTLNRPWRIHWVSMHVMGNLIIILAHRTRRGLYVIGCPVIRSIRANEATGLLQIQPRLQMHGSSEWTTEHIIVDCLLQTVLLNLSFKLPSMYVHFLF